MKHDVNRIIACASAEIENPVLGVTEQFLEIHEVVYLDGKPVVARVDVEKENGDAIVYFLVEGEKFYFAVYLDTEPEISVRWTDTEDYHSACFIVTSEILDAAALSAMTNLTPTESWTKGDKWRKTERKCTVLRFEPNPEADEFEDKIEKLLNYLLTDKENIKRLVEQYDGSIQVISIFHNGNTMLGGVHLNKGIINKLSELNLCIDFDLYAEGNLFKEEDGSWYE